MKTKLPPTASSSSIRSSARPHRLVKQIKDVKKNSEPTKTKKNEQKEKEKEDASVLKPSIETSVGSLNQIITVMNKATPEVLKLVDSECSIIFECKICKNLFRSLANFMSHKRGYCLGTFEELLQKHATHQEVFYRKEKILTTRSTTRKDILSLLDTMKQITTEHIIPDHIFLQNIPATNEGFFNLRYKAQEAVNEETVTINPVETPITNGHCDSEDTCSFCHKDFSSQKALSIHIKKDHGDLKVCFVCPCCKKYFTNTWSVYRHLYKVHRKTSEQVRKLRSQIQKKQISQDEFNKSKQGVMTSPQEEKNRDKAFMEDLRGHDSLQRCSECGKHFERKVALLAHASHCQRKPTGPSELVRSLKRKSLTPMKVVDQKKAKFSGPVTEEMLMRLKNLDPRVVLTKADLPSTYEKSLSKENDESDDVDNEAGLDMTSLLQKYRDEFELDEDTLNKIHSEVKIEESTYLSDSDIENDWRSFSATHSPQPVRDYVSQDEDNISRGESRNDENISDDEAISQSDDDQNISQDDDVESGSHEEEIQSVDECCEEEESVADSESLPPESDEDVSDTEQDIDEHEKSGEDEASSLSASGDEASQDLLNTDESPEKNKIEHEEDNEKTKEENNIMDESSKEDEPSLVEEVKEDTVEMEEVDEENIEIQEVSPDNTDMLLDDINGQEYEKASDQVASHVNISNPAGEGTSQDKEKETNNDKSEINGNLSTNKDNDLPGPSVSNGPCSKYSDLEDFECNGFIGFSDPEQDTESELDDLTEPPSPLPSTTKMAYFESISELNSKDCSNLEADKDNTCDNMSHSSFISMKHHSIFTEGGTSQSSPTYDLDDSNYGVAKEIVLSNYSEGSLSGLEASENSISPTEMENEDILNKASDSSRSCSMSPADTQSLDQDDESESPIDNSDWLTKKINSYMIAPKKKCLLCYKTFHRVNFVRRHVASHFNINKFKCLVNSCNFLSYLRSDINNHLMKAHKKKELETFVGRLYPKKEDFNDNLYIPDPKPLYAFEKSFKPINPDSTKDPELRNEEKVEVSASISLDSDSLDNFNMAEEIEILDGDSDLQDDSLPGQDKITTLMMEVIFGKNKKEDSEDSSLLAV